MNKTFSGGVESKFNATVGYNGSGTSVGSARPNTDYAIGFSNAALSLIKTSLESTKLDEGVDYFVYPICFNMRHSVELRLKKYWKDLYFLSGIEDMQKDMEEQRRKGNNSRNGVRGKHKYNKISMYRDSKVIKLNGLKNDVPLFPDVKEVETHDLEKIWCNFKEYATVIDTRFEYFILLLDEIITDIGSIDPTGQTFRYPESNTSQVHLADTPLINVLLLKVRFEQLNEVLSYLDDFMEEIKREYRCVISTTNLSYFDIYKIITAMEPFSKGDTPYYVAAKEAIMSEFGIGSNEYGRLLSVIRNDKTINSIQNSDNALDFNDVDSIERFFELVYEFNKMGATDGDFCFDFSDPDCLNRLFDSIKTSDDGVDVISLFLSEFDDEKISEIIALYDFHKQYCYYSEYVYRMARIKDELLAISGCNRERMNFARHYFEKTNLVSGIIISLYNLNIKTLAHSLIKKYDLKSQVWCQNLLAGKVSDGFSSYKYFIRKIDVLTDKKNTAQRIAINIRHQN